MQEDDIFTNQKDVVENLKGSAKNLGIDPSKVVPPEPKKQQVLVAKKSCKKCWGQGVLTIAGHDVSVRTPKKSDGESILSVLNEEGELPQTGKFIKTNGRNSSKPEPQLKTKGLTYCSCVKLVEASLQSA